MKLHLEMVAFEVGGFDNPAISPFGLEVSGKRPRLGLHYSLRRLLDLERLRARLNELRSRSPHFFHLATL